MNSFPRDNNEVIQLPQFVKPMLATLAEPFDSKEYTYEIKWDGYRSLAFLDSATKLQSRNLKDITPLFPELRQLHSAAKKPGIILDGEIIALRDGKPSFSELQKRGQLRNEAQIRNSLKAIPVIYVVFDILYSDYQPVFSEPIEKRRRLLAENLKPSDAMITAKYIEDHGNAYFNSICEMGLEGVIAKKKGSLYLPGKRVKTWLKFKRKQHGNFIVVGYVLNPTSRGELSSLILGAYLGNKLTCFGMVGTGFTREELALILTELKKITVATSPLKVFKDNPPNVFWTRPIIVCEIEYLELTDDGKLRHPSFIKFRPDLKPEECIFED